MESVVAVNDGEQGRSDLQLIGDYARRNWWVVAGCIVAALAAGLLYLALSSPGYRATAVLLIQPQSQDGAQQNVVQQLATPELVRSQLEILRSQRVLGQTVGKLNLDRDPDFIKEVGDGASPQLRATAARDELDDRLDVENDGRSYTISLSALARDPALAATIANTVAAAYIDVERAQKVELIESTQQALQRRLADLRDATFAAEQEAEAYRVQSGLVPLSSVPEDSESYAASTPASREIIEMSKEHASLAAQRAQAQARFDAQQRAIAAGQGQATSEVLSSSVVSDLRMREADLAQRQSELLARYSPDHPLVAPVQAELTQVRADIAREIQRIHNSVRSQAAASSAAFSQADVFMGKLSSDRSRDLAASTRLRQLQRDAQIKRDTYEEYAMQMQRASERAGLQLPDVLLISPASPPLKSARPPALLVLVGFALAGLIAGLLLGLLRSMLADRRVIVRETVTEA